MNNQTTLAYEWGESERLSMCIQEGKRPEKITFKLLQERLSENGFEDADDKVYNTQPSYVDYLVNGKWFRTYVIKPNSKYNDFFISESDRRNTIITVEDRFPDDSKELHPICNVVLSTSNGIKLLGSGLRTTVGDTFIQIIDGPFIFSTTGLDFALEEI